MKVSATILAGLALMVLTACSTPVQKQDAGAVKQETSTEEDGLSGSGQNPPMTRSKAGKKLSLVRVMDGAACKDELEGAKGTFLVYADQDDIERIKKDKGTQVFADFEHKIEAFSSEGLQKAIDETNLDIDPFALDENEAQQKLISLLTDSFHRAVKEPLGAFEKETSLTIDVTTFPPSFTFYQKGCDVNILEPEEPEQEPAQVSPKKDHSKKVAPKKPRH